MTDETPVAYGSVPEFPGYRVGDDGSVWSCWVKGANRQAVLSDKWSRLKPGLAGGYLFVVLCRNKKHFKRYVHRLVLEVFVGPCPAGKECAHDNGNRLDCRLTNLFWKTRPQNQADKIRHNTLLKGEKHHQCKLTEREVIAIRAGRANGASYKSLARTYSISTSHVHSIVTRRVWADLSPTEAIT